MRTVEVSGLRVELAGRGIPVVDDVSFGLTAGEVVGLVGESGCGKSTVSMALMGYVRRGLEVAKGQVRIDGNDILALSEAQRRRLRGTTVAYVPQDPATALNPAMKVGQQLLEGLQIHEIGRTGRERLGIVRERLTEVGLPATDEFLDRFPHEISGGQQQRVSIAVAFSCLPRVLLCDEPTTGLDVSTQERVLQTIQELSAEHEVATLYVSHDLAVVSEISDRVMVMYAGRVVESATVGGILAEPRHPYSKALWAAMPKLGEPRSLESIPGMAPRPLERLGGGCAFAPRCVRSDTTCLTLDPALEIVGDGGREVACFHPVAGAPSRPAMASVQLRKDPPFPTPTVLTAENLSIRYGSKTVVTGATFSISEGECLAVVGESGSGKTTLSRGLAGLVAPIEGTVTVHGERVNGLARQRTALQRQRLQMVFQNPYASLNPRRTVGDSVGTPARHIFGVGRREARERAAGAMELGSLTPKLLHSYPDQLSGGERQRAAIARALICEPDVLICDEVTSALDVSIQASIINLLLRLKDERGVALLFVTHNLPLVNSLAELTMVLKDGVTVEHGATSDVLNSPKHAYTQALLRDTPKMDLIVPVSETS